MVKNNAAKTARELVFGYLPKGLRQELTVIGFSDRDVRDRLSELRLRSGGISFALCGSRRLPLSYRTSEDELEALLHRLCDGAVYAHREGIMNGFIPIGAGVRVGVIGRAAYESGRAVGVSSVSALVFRLPSGECDFAERLYGDWLSLGSAGLLIVSPPAGGKTTALRSLAGLIGSGRQARRVLVVDERCEFIPEDYREASVDLLRGYKRARGIDIAIRTMSAEVVIADEIGTKEESEAMLGAAGAGVTVIAAAHGRELCDVFAREGISPLIKSRTFEFAAIIKRNENGFDYRLHSLTSHSA